MNNKRQLTLAAILLASILVVDQVVKILVKTNMMIGEEIPLIGDWCRLHFIENEGMAFGFAFGGFVGKLLLSLIRIVASAGIIWLIVNLVKKGTRTSLVVCLTLILAGAIGNLIDSCLYGLIFNESFYTVATLFPPEGGYAPFMHGKVVDMFYFPLFEFDWPTWVPFVGGRHFEFFNAIFNVADASITIGVIWLVIDQLFLAKNDKESLGKAVAEAKSGDEGEK